MELKPDELKIITFRPAGSPIDSGASGVRIVHIPTGTQVTVDKHKSYFQNRDVAIRDLTLKLREIK